MAVFEDIELEWKGVTYTLNGDDKVMRAIAAVEDHVTISELQASMQSGNIALGKLSIAYSVLLKFAGCFGVTSAQVYQGMWDGGVSQEAIGEAIGSLIAIMIPPDAFRDDSAPKPDGKKKTGKKKASSKRRTRRG